MKHFRKLGLALSLTLALALSPARPAPVRAAGGYLETVTFKFDQTKATYKKGITTAYLMLDKEGGLNPLWGARQMTRQGNIWSTTAKLPEGDYIYVFVANADKHVNLSDCSLNEDDVPDSNFFNDPSPTFKGFGGQYGKDNVYLVRDPLRPQFIKDSPSPKPGSLFTSSAPIILSVKARPGSAKTAIDAKAIKVDLHDNEPRGMFRTAGAPPKDTLTAVKNVKVTTGAGGVATITAAITAPPEGFHEVDFHVVDTAGRTGDKLTVGFLVNRKNQAPVASAGPTRFGRVGAEVQLDGGESDDPDRIGISKYAWRKVSGPGSLTFKCYDQERVQRDSFWVLAFDSEGNGKGNVVSCDTMGTGPRVTATAAGTYRVGLKVQDHQGAWSAEAFTDVHVVSGFSAAVRPRVDVVQQGNKVTLDGRATGASSGYKWYQGAENPQQLGWTNLHGGRARSFSVPSKAGAYYFYLQVGSSYPRTAVVRVGQGGKVTGQELDDQDRFWKDEAVIYMVFVRMFNSSQTSSGSSGGSCSGAPQGDFQGLIKKLPYLRDLGVNVLWVMPTTPGPTTHGYAATALFDVEEDYGSLSDWDAFAKAAHRMGFKIMFDLVANHTSDQHPLFRAAYANPASVLRQWYVFNAGNTTRPFEYAFDFSTLPSLNYNNPLVRRMFLDVIDFWMEHGVDAFRCDIASFVPPSFWRAARRHVIGRQPGGAILAEIIPPSPGFFDEQFDLAYHSYLYWNFKDIFAKTGGLDSFDKAMTSGEKFIQSSAITHVKEKVDPANVLTMRYLDTQDEDRYLLQAGHSKDALKAGAGALSMLPGTPMIYYGDEQGLAQSRGPMKFDAAGDTKLHALYRRLLMIRNNNPGLQGQDTGALGEVGDTYTRINNDSDKGGSQVYSFSRYGDGQHFAVLVNRFKSSSLGTPVTIYPPKAHLADYGSSTLWLVNHNNPTDQIPTDKTSLLAGFTASVGSHDTKIYQITEAAIPDADDDKVLDSYDSCRGTKNADQADADGDGVGDSCDKCASTAAGAAVDVQGCQAQSKEPRQRYVLDGAVDDPAYKIAEASGIKLHASFNGRQLYVAASAAQPGTDVFILVTTPTTAKISAPFSKAGKVAFTGRYLADEGESNYSAWFKVTGAARAATPKMAASGAGVLEGTLNLVEIYGAKIPKSIRIAAARYGTASGGGLKGQAPATKDGNGDVDSAEFVTFTLKDPTPPPPTPPPDTDKDGVVDTKDNCPSVPNSKQDDFDGDSIGDLCDLCPATSPGAAVDGYGCERAPGAAYPDSHDQGLTQSEGCGYSPSPAPGSRNVLLLLALLVVSLLFRFRHASRRSRAVRLRADGRSRR